ncbi:MAG: DUF502 domain-containing protein [Bacteroidota bacterium]|nr:DUF502 domain-containing protein [Bacteroidota bacterium]
MKVGKLGQRVLNYFFQGLIFIVPLSVTIYVLVKTFLYVDGLLRDYVSQWLGFYTTGLGILVMLVGLTIIGFLGSTIVFKPLLVVFDRLVSKAPLVKIIYTSVKDLLSAFVGQKKKFSEPVLVKESRNSDMEKIGFITAHDLTKLGIPESKVAVYLPYSYNVSGMLIIVPVENVKHLDSNSTDVMKFVISAGVTQI